MLRNIPKLCLSWVRWNPIHVDIEPNPMPYIANLWRKRHPHRLKNAYEVTHDEVPPDLYEWPTLEQRLSTENKPSFKTITDRPPEPSVDELRENHKIYGKNKRSFTKCKLQRENKMTIDLEMVNEEWGKSLSGISAIHSIAHHYGVFKDLLGSYDFYPISRLQLVFDCGCYSLGDFCTPSQMKSLPRIHFPFDHNKQYTVMIVNLDGNPISHLSSLQWMIANSRGKFFEEGTEIIQYVQPYPLRGIGYHRIVCVVFEQNDKIDMEKRRHNVLEDRSFDTVSFFCENRNKLKPVGLAIVQCKWDQSVSDIFHQHFGIGEPVYEYDLKEESPPPQVDVPEGQPFNEYLDVYRDQKEINAEALLAYLENTCPFRGPLNDVPFPHAEPFPPDVPTWKQEETRDMWSRINQWAHIPRTNKSN